MKVILGRSIFPSFLARQKGGLACPHGLRQRAAPLAMGLRRFPKGAPPVALSTLLSGKAQAQAQAQA